ncbi:protein of unknown function (4846) [Chitinophaga jiangningensis]|uniref:DUF4846 domain-containing protein n=1 Tax=Chitinophaga jiangningensis TaxID=1419482 RepID=A0A1M6XT20_9BACT|nr:DUF4846 domain-containing protein [Chitinophaga jiangningensis]SHL09056.1 protein of unknown function (4846) [Chitinophaga jiangningensis]
MKLLFILLLPLTSFAQTVGNIPAPAGFERAAVSNGSFGQWLRTISLKQHNTVYLYNGQLKQNQEAQAAVLDISVGKKDLQQCADAVMRLRAEWLYAHEQYNRIAFHATDGTLLDYAAWQRGCRFQLKNQRLAKVCNQEKGNSRTLFQAYLELVFSYAGTTSLERELVPAAGSPIQPGDVFIQGGSPGHAVIVMDVITNRTGKKKFMLAQSYMPAQDIHILKNPADGSCWYNEDFGNLLRTPEWTFNGNALHHWPD